MPTEANIAFFIQVSQSTAGHLPRLLARLHHPKNVYAVHLDAKMEPELVESVMRLVVQDGPAATNVHYMQQELITYRGVSMVLNTINAMKMLLEKGSKWDYFINISGSDYPLVSPLFLRRLLGKHVRQKFNFVSFAAEHAWRANLGYRVEHFYVDEALGFGSQETQVVQSSQTNPLAETMQIRYVNSEAWMINSREFCRFVVTDGYARKMLLTFAYSVEASEHYFASLLWNHGRFNRTIVPRALRHVLWEHEGRRAGQHPFLLDERDEKGEFRYKKVIETSPNLFARKFEYANSPLMDFIDGRLDDEEHIAGVHKLYNWVTGVAIDLNRKKGSV